MTPMPMPEMTNATIYQVAVTVSTFVWHPLWILKTRTQLGLPFTLLPNIAYRGLTSSLALSPFFTATAMLHEQLQKQIHQSGAERSKPLLEFGSALLAGIALTPISTPVAMVVTKMQTEKVRMNTLGTIRKIIRDTNGRGFYAGFTSFAIQDAIWAAAFFYSERVVKRIFCDEKQPEMSLKQPFLSLVSGGVAGTAAWLFTQPLNLIATLRQNDCHRREYSDYRMMIRTLYNRGGIGSFYRGGAMRWTYLVLDMMVMSLTIDKLKEMYGDNGL